MATLAPFIFQQEFDDNGNPLAGGLLYTYAAGGTTPKATYTTYAGDVECANPIVLDSAGRYACWLGTGAYKFVLTDANGISIGDTIDNYTASNVGTGTVSIVATIAAIKALAAGATTAVYAEGYYAAGDGGGGWFYWSAASSATDDGGAIITPTSAPSTGRWLRIWNGDIDVRAYGAKGTGTDNDRTAFAAANTYAAAQNKRLIAHTGTYLLTTTPSMTVPIKLSQKAILSWSAYNLVVYPIIDDSDDSKHFTCALADYPVFNAGIVSRPQWFGALADGSTNDTIAVSCAADAIPAAGGTLLFTPTANSYLVGGSGDTAYVVTLKSNLHIKGMGETSMIKLAASTAATGIIGHTFGTALTNISIEDIGLDGNAANNTVGNAIYIDCDGGYIRNCLIKDFDGYGIYSTCINFEIENNNISACGIYIAEAEATRIRNNVIEATTAATMAYGISVTPPASTTITDLDIVGNTLVGCNITCLGVTATSRVIDRLNIYDNLVDLSRTDLGGTSNPSCIQVYTATGEVHISRNKCYPNTVGGGVTVGDPATVVACQYDVSDNVIRMTDLTAGALHNGINIYNVSGGVVKNNNIRASSSTGDIYGILESGTCTNINYGPNIIINFTADVLYYGNTITSGTFDAVFSTSIFTESKTITCAWKKETPSNAALPAIVTLSLPGFNGTAAATTSFAATGTPIPATIRPAAIEYKLMVVDSSATNYLGVAVINSTGALSFGLSSTPSAVAVDGGFPGNVEKGIINTTIQYAIWPV
jgi:hypothetical protein